MILNHSIQVHGSLECICDQLYLAPQGCCDCNFRCLGQLRRSGNCGTFDPIHLFYQFKSQFRVVVSFRNTHILIYPTSIKFLMNIGRDMVLFLLTPSEGNHMSKRGISKAKAISSLEDPWGNIVHFPAITAHVSSFLKISQKLADRLRRFE